jgi:polysaccharide biosynthesis transport protein
MDMHTVFKKMEFYSINQIIAIVRARWRLVASCMCVVLVFTLGILMLMPKRYQASTSILFNTKASDPVAEKNDAISFIAYMQSEMELMNSEKVTDRLANDPGFFKLKVVQDYWQKERKGSASISRWLTKTLPTLVTTKTGKQSRVIELYVQARHPQFAMVTANALANAYLDTNLELRVAPARQNAKWFERQRKLRFETLLASQARLTGFLLKTGMTGQETKSDIDDMKLRTLSSELAQVQAARAKADGEQQTMSAGTALGIGLISNPTAQKLRTAIADQRVMIRDLATDLGPNHPRMLAEQQKLLSLQMEFDAENADVRRDLERKKDLARSQEVSVRQMTERQRNSMSASSVNRAKLDVLLDDVERTRLAYTEVTASLRQIELASALEKPNASILSEATLPESSGSPNWQFSLALAAASGLLFGIFAALMAEYLRPRVRQQSDIRHFLPNLTVLSDLNS